MSMVPMTGNKFSANPWMVDHLPEIYMSMGLTAEQVQKLAQEQCFGETVAQRVDTDYWLDACPALVPGRATFVCAPKPKPK